MQRRWKTHVSIRMVLTTQLILFRTSFNFNPSWKIHRELVIKQQEDEKKNDKIIASR